MNNFSLRSFFVVAALFASGTLAVPSWAAKPMCGIVEGKFVADCPEPAIPGGTRDEELRTQECRQLASEIGGQTGRTTFSGNMLKDDLQKLHTRRCTPHQPGTPLSGDTPECNRIAADLRGLAGTQTQVSLVKKTDLLRQYDMLCGYTAPRRPAVILVR